ncbi:MAG TPA: hypothetical protein VFJ02_03995 [Vicinamibacterales bacterium]|nr:hypothetical protein [Vicinamibacterales bacterium]
MRFIAGMLVVLGLGHAALAQVPQPFPKPSTPQKPDATNGSAAAQKVEPPQRPGAPTDSTAPTEAALGLPIYPTAEFLASYDAGRGQRYYLFGTNATFVQIVEYYKTVLKQRGELVFDEPPVHMFEVGRFREETMAFPPGVTVKDYAWAGGLGYINPKRGAEPARFKTVIQIVPSPPVVGR